MAHDGVDIQGEAGVIEGGGEVLGVAAVAHVHADDVCTGTPELVGVADDVLGVGGAFEAVDDDGGGAGGAGTSAGCQWHWQRTWLEIWLSVAGETSTKWGSGGGR